MYFDHLKTPEEIKERYRLLAKKLHPDVGGDKTIMQEINLEYDRLMNGNSSHKQPRKPEKKASYKVDEDNQKKIYKVLKWAKDNPHFDTSFVESLQEQIKHRDLTNGQETALDNIILKFKIHQEEKT